MTRAEFDRLKWKFESHCSGSTCCLTESTTIPGLLRFTLEWSYLADSLNGIITEGDFRYLNAALVAQIEDSATYDGLDKKWEVDVESFCEKIRNLSSASVEAVFRRVEAFWNSGSQELEEWAKY